MTSQKNEAQKNKRLSDGGIESYFHNRNWTTEALIDKLADYIVGIKSHHVSYYYGTSKYLAKIADFISRSNWSNNQRNMFSFDLTDILAVREDDDGEGNNIIHIGDRMASELIELYKTAPSTLDYVLRQVLKRLFALVSASWFYESISENSQLDVILVP